MPLTRDADRLSVRLAGERDLPALVAMFAADDLGGHGDTTAPDVAGDYLAAFRAICANPATRLYVAELDGQVVGTFQLVLARALPSRGALRAILEAVQIAPDRRSGGLGARMVQCAMAEASAAGAATLALTSNMRRVDAHRFYEKLGFSRSHFGFKITL